MSRQQFLIVGAISSCVALGAGLLVARVASLEQRLAALESRPVVVSTPTQLVRNVDSQGVIRSAEGNVIGHWGIDEPLSFQKITY